MAAVIGWPSLDVGAAEDVHYFWGFRANNLENHDKMARQLAGAIYHLDAYACLYAMKETNLVRETIYWIHLRAPRRVWEKIWRAVGGFGGWVGVMKPEVLENAIKEAQAGA